MSLKELKISAIREGTVIDHVPAKQSMKVVEILNLDNHRDVLSIATNLRSKKVGKKGMLKIGGKSLTKKEFDKIALIAPKATISIIKNYKVVDKQIVDVPDELDNIAVCINPNCITNHGSVRTRFKVVNKKPIKIRCEYCERFMSQQEIEIK